MIPYNTDAPLYYPPVATVALIVLNSVLFFIVPRAMLEPSSRGGEGFAWGVDDAAVVPEQELPDAPAEDWDAGDFRVVDDALLAEPAGEEPADFLATPATANRPEPWELSKLPLALQYGVGLKPWQWLSSIFMHADFFHLLFNMIALWAFGLVVEGKVGGLVFSAIYLAIGVAQSGLEQTLMLFAAEGGSCGASAAIFGILGVAVVWAPRNDFEVFWSFGLRAGSIEVPILMYGVLVLVIEGVSIALERFSMSSGVLHLMGLALGVAVGFIWLRRNWVDCEGWDLINVWRGTAGRAQPDHQLDDQARQLVRDSIRGRKSAASVADKDLASLPARGAQKVQPSSSRRRTKQPADQSQAHAQALRDVEQLIADGNVATALKLLSKLKVHDPSLQLSQTALHGLIKALLAAQHFTAAVPFMREYTARFTQHRVPMQLNLAKLLLHLQQPRKAADVLRGLRPAALEPSAQTTWQELAAHAQHQINEGVVEVSDEG